MLIAAQILFRAGLALSVIASQCHLSQGERLWQAGRRKEPLSEIAAPRGVGYLAEFHFLLDITFRIEHRTLCGVRLSCGVGTPQMTRTPQTLRSSNLRRYYIKYLEHRKMFYHSSAAVRASQSRHAFPAFPGACCFYSDVVFQLPEVASASAPETPV